MANRYRITLTPDEREMLEAITRSVKTNAPKFVIRRFDDEIWFIRSLRLRINAPIELELSARWFEPFLCAVGAFENFGETALGV